MNILIFLIFSLIPLISASYEESIDEMLVQCNSYQNQVYFKNRTIHDCEKEDPDGDYSYHITPMFAHYSRRKFLCVLFFKDDDTQLNFKLLFSHGNFRIDAYGIVFNKPDGSRFESSASFPISVLVILPDKGSQELEILEWQINGEDQCPACGEKIAQSDARALIAGEETDHANWPWHATLWKAENNHDITYICGGAILNKKWIITAAHCLYSSGEVISETTLKVRIPKGKFITEKYSSYNVKTLIPHENYNTTNHKNDIALLMLKETLDLTKSFRSICFSQLGNLPQAASGFAIGYGSTDKQQTHSVVMREVEMPIIEVEECRDHDMGYFDEHLFEGNFCAGEVNVERGVCAGDSGGGLYVRINNNWYLQGLTSNTKKSENRLNPTCNYETYAIFTNVPFYADWINYQLTHI